MSTLGHRSRIIRDDAPGLVAGAPGAVDVGGSELGEQEVAAAEDIERQEAAVLVIAVEEGVLLASVGLHVGGVDIEDEACRRRRVAGVEKQGDEQVGEFLEIGGDPMVSALAGVPGVLDAVQRGLAGERRRRFAVGRAGLPPPPARSLHAGSWRKASWSLMSS